VGGKPIVRLIVAKPLERLRTIGAQPLESLGRRWNLKGLLIIRLYNSITHLIEGSKEPTKAYKYRLTTTVN